MDTNQIYGIVNDVVAQGIGSTAVAVVDEQGLISLGQEVLSSSANTEAFLNTLIQRVGRTIVRFRKYQNKLAGMLLDDFEYGAIVQKVRVAMPDAEADESFGLVDGQSVDHYKIAKPEAQQKLFVTRTPYQYKITIQRKHLKEAFLSEAAMGQFIAAVFGEVRNAIDLGLERLARNAINNMIAECYTGAGGTAGRTVVNLGTLYRALNPNAPATAAGLMNEPDFLRFAVSTINSRIDSLEEMSTLNTPDANALPTFTPRDRMHVYIMSPFKRRLETVVQYAAFNEGLVNIGGNDTLTYLQGQASPLAINVERASDGEAVSVDNIVGLLYDRDACGAYKWDEEVSTTPLNSAGLYYNTYYHLQQLWFNDLSENFVVFTLN